MSRNKPAPESRPKTSPEIDMNTPATFSRVRISLTALALLLLTASLSTGFIWVSNLRAEDEYRQMIYNISTAMGENPACYE